MDAETLLTEQLKTQIIASIRSGAYAHVAAQAWCVSPALLDEWLRRGTGPGATEPYASFAKALREAEAQARLRAEMEAFQSDPRAWLSHGPGRESGDSRGWSAAVKAADGAGEGANPLRDPRFVELAVHLLTLLIPFPEARRLVAQALWERDVIPKSQAA